jgi:uncharacterized protein YaaN involved in tellurite resistance
MNSTRQPLLVPPSIGDGKSATAFDEDAEIRRLVSSIDILSPASISAFGSEVADRTSGYADELLSKAKLVDLEETGQQLNEIVQAAQAFDLDSLDNRMSRAPVIGGLMKMFVRSKEKAVAKFDSVKDQVDKVVTRVEGTARRLEARSADYKNMYDGVRREHLLLGLHVAAIKLKLKEIDTEIAAQGDYVHDLSQSEHIALLESSRYALSKRGDDLEILQHSALQTLPMVRVIQANNIALIDKFNTIRRLTLPAWKRSFLLALALDEQRGAVALANNIDDATNHFMRKNAELLHQNAVATAKSNQRLVIDIDTLREVHNKIIDALNDVRSAHEEGSRARADALVQLEVLRNNMVNGVKQLGNDR